ncbi:hypothetical protein O3G_MSEX014637 [Manduca sexta]|uniref:Uncharacterized protein n=1 Tax=Manduca sexta TaxID=7130 RepID=A0A921ZW03_MANSE|nr:hypothetical protein O3G_MSEX014637 [Manduca sexta]
MSAPGLTSEAQLRYMLQWFGEFSELQREDFLPILAASRGDKPDQLAATMSSMSCQEKPVSLFQCRIKLFNEWYPTWSEEEQDRLVKSVSDMDAEFGSKLQELLKNNGQINGEQNGTDIFTEEKTEESWGGEQVQANEDDEVVSNDLPVEIAAAS